MVLHFCYVYCFVTWGVWSWYFAPYGLFVIFAGVEILDNILKRIQSLRAAAMCVCAVILLIIGFSRFYAILGMKSTRLFATPSYNAALWAKSHSDPLDVFALSDCGFFGFFSERRVINLDGLMNDRSYQESLRQQRLGKYLKDNNVKYLVCHDSSPFFSGGFDKYDTLKLTFPSYLYHMQSDELLLPKMAERYRDSKKNEEGKVTFIIWEIDK